MDMDIIQRLTETVRERKLTVALPEGRDERIIRVARRLHDEKIARPVVLGRREQIDAAIEKAGVGLDGIAVIDPKTSDRLDAYVEAYHRRRSQLCEPIARNVVVKPMFFAGMMVTCGDADAFVGGAAIASSIVIQAGMLTIGLKAGIQTPSSYFLMVVPPLHGEPEKLLLYADCAVNIDPSPEQLADIAIATAATARQILGEPPRVAMLSFSTRGSASGSEVGKVTEALERVRDRQPGLIIDGEFQLDTALASDVAIRKTAEHSAVAGKANVFIFPDLNSGNIAYKVTQYMAHARAIGPILQGFARPISDLSRGAGVNDIIAAVVLTLAQVPVAKSRTGPSRSRATPATNSSPICNRAGSPSSENSPPAAQTTKTLTRWENH
jgi:phosphate acetyltransferase